MPPQFELNSNFDFYNLISNPDRFDNSDSDSMLQLPLSKYHSVDEINNITQSEFQSANSLFLLHINIRSLSKHIDELQNNLNTLSCQPDIIAIRETKLNDNSITNIAVENFEFFHTNSTMAAGGSALYVKNELHATERKDIRFVMEQVESTWVELPRNNLPSIIIG